MSTPAAAVTEAQAQSHLAATRDAVLAHCATLTPEAWHRSNGPGRWTPAQILEHLVIVEQRVGGALAALLEQPPVSDWRERTAAQEPKIAAAAVATTKVDAPPATHPQGKQTPAELLAAFAAGREPLLALAARRAELEQRVRMHAAIGELNGWQWLRLVGYHSQRHLAQMQAIR
jgi:hypothetical protein